MTALKLPTLPTIPSPDAHATPSSDARRSTSDDSSDPTVAAASPDPQPQHMPPMVHPGVDSRAFTQVGPSTHARLEEEDERSWRTYSSPLPPVPPPGVRSSEPGRCVCRRLVVGVDRHRPVVSSPLLQQDGRFAHHPRLTSDPGLVSSSNGVRARGQALRGAR